MSSGEIKFVKEAADIGNLDFAIRDVIAAVQMDINFLKYYNILKNLNGKTKIKPEH